MPALVIGTSWLVDAGQHRYRALSSMAAVKDRLGSTPYDVVILGSVYNEYNTLWEKGVLGDHQIPKASSDVITELNPQYFPQPLRDMLPPAKELWRATSRKAKAGGWLDRADMEVIAFVYEQAENERECYVFTYDEDEVSPVKSLASQYPHIHLAEESLQPARRLMNEFDTEDHQANRRPVLMFPDVLGELYSMEPTIEPSYYVLAARAPLAGGTEEVWLSTHPLESGTKLEEGGATRYPLLVTDTSKLIAEPDARKKDFIRKRNRGVFEKALNALDRKYTSCKHISPVKSRAYSTMRLLGIDRRLMLRNGVWSVDKRGEELEWLVLTEDYLKAFSSATLDALAEFRGRFPK